MRSLPRKPPTATLINSFVALAEALVPREKFCDWPADENKLAAAARKHPRWAEVVGNLDSDLDR